MVKNVSTSLIVLGMLTLCGCVTTTTTPEGERVRVTSNEDVVEGCQYLGEAVGKDRMNGGWAGQGAAEENAHRRLKNNAASMGATHVLMTTEDVGTSGAVKRGEAYRCPG